MKVKFLFICLLVSSSILLHAYGKQDNYQNFVPDEQTAIKIAEAIWLPIYGKEINNEKPYTVRLKNDSVWVVCGSLPPHSYGGVAYIEIQKKDCKILKVTHGR